MTVGAAFNGSTSVIVTGGTDLTIGAFTIGGVYYEGNAGGSGALLVTDLGSNNGLALINNGGTWYLAITNVTFVTGPAVISGYQAIFCSKATGSVTPRFHVYNGSSWSHTDASGAIANPNGAITRMILGQDNVGTTPLTGEIATLGVWNEDTTDGNIETYLDYLVLAAKSNKQFFTNTSLVSAGTLNDDSANNNDETSRTAISAGSQTIPAWFTNFPPTDGTVLGRSTRLIEFVKQVGTVTNTSAATTSAITVAAGGVPVGNSVVILSSADNSSASGAIQASTVSDTRGNTWNYCTHAIADPSTTALGQEGFIAWANITTALQASDTITITWPASTTAKAARADEFKYMGGLLEQQVQNDQTSTTSSVTVTPTGVGQLVIGGIMVEGGTADTFTQDADTTNGSWVNPGRLGSGTTTSGATLNPIYKIVTAAGAQTYNPTMGTARDHCAALAVFRCLPYDTRPDAFGRHHGRARMRRR